MVPSRLICSYFCYGICSYFCYGMLFKNVVLTVLISSLSPLCRHLIALGLIRRKAPSYFSYSSSARRLSHQEQKLPSFEERLCRGMRLSHCSLSSGSLSGWRCSGTSVIIADIVPTAVIIAINPSGRREEGQVEWESAAAEDPISDKLTKRSRRPQMGSVVLVRMSEEGE